jgi:1-deoxy-D-xylulose-5-phosphate synthase
VGRILDRIRGPEDLRPLSPTELTELAREIRAEIIETVDANGGHLATNLGVVELTLALHRVFDSPHDKLVWDTSNQTYAHKLVTGRAPLFRTLRKTGGLSGFAAREESPHDVIGAGHAGTGVSAGAGVALAERLKGTDASVVTVIGDGSFTSGVVFEALNQAGDLKLPFVLVLNDNGMSISPNVGALARNLGQDRTYAWQPPQPDGRFTPSQLSTDPTSPTCTAEEFFAAFGFEYIGPLDGHDRVEIEAALTDAKARRRPVVVHLFTQKGRGLPDAERDPVTLHQPGTAAAVGAANATSYSKVMAKTLMELAKEDHRIVAISAGMMEGTALGEMQRELPGQVYDVGISESHAVALAAGMASQGLKPVVCIYSTFLQRAFDQIVHDVAIQNLPVVLAVDRAGIVGDDGRTHHGVLDLAYLRAIPNMIVAAPKDENELRHLLRTALDSNQPFALRYSRGVGVGVELSGPATALPIGRGELLREGSDVALLALGWGVAPALAAAEHLAAAGHQAAVVNARFVKPLDADLILHLARRTRHLVTIEDHNAMGGFGSAVLELLADHEMSDVQVRRVALPDEFHAQGPADAIRATHGLSSEGIVAVARELISADLDVSVEAGRLIVRP